MKNKKKFMEWHTSHIKEKKHPSHSSSRRIIFILATYQQIKSSHVCICCFQSHTMSPNGNLAKNKHFELPTPTTYSSFQSKHLHLSRNQNVGTKKSSNQKCGHVRGHAAGCSRLRLPGTFKVQH